MLGRGKAKIKITPPPDTSNGVPLPEIGNLAEGEIRVLLGVLAFLGIQVVTLQVHVDMYVQCSVERSGRGLYYWE